MVVTSTVRMKLKYKKGKVLFTKDNLIITSAKGRPPFNEHRGQYKKEN